MKTAFIPIVLGLTLFVLGCSSQKYVLESSIKDAEQPNITFVISQGKTQITGACLAAPFNDQCEDLAMMTGRGVELWLKSLALSPKSRVHIRGILHQLWDYAMFRGDLAVARNPMELVTIKGATKRRKPRSLTEGEFRRFVAALEEPIRTLALVCVSFGLRISECLALKWSDVDWLHRTLQINRGIVMQHLGQVKTQESEREMSIDPELLAILKSWKQTTQFPTESDWIFASPVQLGRLPISYPHVWQQFQTAAAEAGIARFGTHTLRHTYRSRLDAVGTPIAVQQKLMRHADIRTTMNVYGDVVTDEMQQAHSKVVQMALGKPN